MPFISTPYDGSSRRSSGSSVSSLRGLDRFNPARKSSVYERASTYQPNGAVSSTLASSTSKFQRAKNGIEAGTEASSSYGLSIPPRFSGANPSALTSSSPYSSSRHEPFGASRRDSSASSSYLRSDSNSGSTLNNNGHGNHDYSFGGGSSNSSTLERTYKRSDSSNLLQADNNISAENNNAVVDNNMNSGGRFSSAFSSRKNSVDLIANGMADLTKRINETLARHGLEDKRTIPTYDPPSRPSYSGRLSENRYSRESRDREIVTSPTGSWRKRHDSSNSDLQQPPRYSINDSLYTRPDKLDASRHQTPQPSPSLTSKWEIPDASITSLKTVISRSTSPTSDPKRALRTRIARTTDPIVVEQRRSRKPRVIDASCQTDTIAEFGTLDDYLHTKPDVQEEEPEGNEVVNSPSFDYFARLKQTLMEAPSEKLYVNTPSKFDNDSEDDYYEVKRAPMTMLLPGSQPSKKLSDAMSSTKDETEEESEYTYETDEEEEEEDNLQGRGESLPPDLESYEAKAERVLEEQRERVSVAPELDYIDEEDEDAPPQVTSPKRKKKGTFISGTVDIDDLLAKEQTPTNFALDDSVSSITEPPLAEVAYVLSEPPKKHVDFSPEVESQEVIIDDEMKYEEEDQIGTQDNAEEEWEEEGAGEEEGDWEWEYYEDEASKAEESQVSETAPKEIPKVDTESPSWILKGLKHCVPRIPTRADTDKLIMEYNDFEDDVIPPEEVTEGSMNIAASSGDLTNAEKEMGYKEWLEESAELHKGAHLHLQAEIEAEEDILGKGSTTTTKDSDKANSTMEGECSIKSPTPGKVSKASRLVEKIKNSEEMDLKRVLFSLKTFFQSDKDLVYEFVREGGLSLLIELGEDEEAQLQNLILRALGQIMLYVDGMNGVIENTRAIQFLYKLVLASNPLVCKTAIKLLLVFVEYTESNCLLLIKAINAVDKELGVIPWSNIITTVQNANKDSSRRTAIDTELAMYALTLVNKCLYGIPDQDTFYDQTDYMEELNMSSIIESLTALDTAEGVDGGLMQQVQLYNVALKQEDGEPVTEEEISYLDEDATESGLRTTLRAKADRGKRNKHFQERKSLRYKTKMLADGEVDSQGDMAGISIRDVEIILAKHGLPTSRSGTRLNALTLNGFLDKARGVFNAKISKGKDEEDEEANGDEDDINERDIMFEREGQAKWDEIISNIDRPLRISDLDFTDLTDDSDENEPEKEKRKVDANGIPLPPPIPPPPPPGLMNGDSVPPPPPPAPTMNGIDSSLEKKWQVVGRKSKKTAKLFWKEIRLSQAFGGGHQSAETIWDDMEPAGVDTAMIEYLFENRAKEAASGKDNKQAQLSSTREIIVLDHKRSNAINIGMTKLPPPRVIKSAVMKMDSTIMNREGVEKLLTMLPTEEETTRINEAQEAQPDIPLGTAEQFLQTLSSISCLEARLRLWSFKMEFEVIEKEVCEPLMDLKVGLIAIRRNTTFKTILNVLLTFGNFLNGSACRGFQLDYLEKVPEVKDTVHKHSLLYHMTYWVLETYPASSDLYSEIGPLTRVSRTDFNELEKTLKRMESECKNAWDYLKIITRHDEKQLKILQAQQNSEMIDDSKVLDDPNEPMRKKVQEFLTDAAERIFIMMKVQKRIHKRYIEFLTWMGIPVHFHADYPVHKSCKILSEFALEYRTTRERVIQTIEKKKAARERKRREKKAAQIAAALAEAAKLQKDASAAAANAAISIDDIHANEQTKRISREEMEDTQLRLLLGQDIDITENGTLRRKKKHHHSSRHHHKHKKGLENEAIGEDLEENMNDLQRKFDEREHHREKKSRRHRSSMLEGTLPLTEDNLKNFASNEMERGLLETLMATSDSSTLKRNKERRKSVKERRSHDLKRSRTRENNVLDDLESAAEALANL